MFDQCWPTLSRHHLTSIFWGYFCLIRSQLLAQKLTFSKHFDHRPSCRLTTENDSSSLSPLTEFDWTILGWFWLSDQAEFDWRRPSCFEDILLLLWPALTFRLKPKFDCRNWQGCFEFQLSKSIWLLYSLSLLNYCIIIRKIDQRVFPTLGFFLGICQIWCSLVLACLKHFFLWSTFTVNVISTRTNMLLGC